MVNNGVRVTLAVLGEKMDELKSEISDVKSCLKEKEPLFDKVKQHDLIFKIAGSVVLGSGILVVVLGVMMKFFGGG